MSTAGSTADEDDCDGPATTTWLHVGAAVVAAGQDRQYPLDFLLPIAFTPTLTSITDCEFGATLGFGWC